MVSQPRTNQLEQSPGSLATIEAPIQGASIPGASWSSHSLSGPVGTSPESPIDHPTPFQEAVKGNTARRRFLLRALLLGAAGIATLGFIVFDASHPSASESSKQLPAQSSSERGNGTELLVRAYRIPDLNQSQRDQRAFTGTLQARYQTTLGFRIGGKIISRHIENGDRVQQGQLLMQLDSVDAELQLAVAESDLRVAKSLAQQVEAEEARLLEPMRSGSVSRTDYDLAVAARDTARARVDAAERRLLLAKNQRAYCDLRADADGLVTLISAEVGTVVAPGQPVMQWVQGTELEAVVSIPESLHHEIAKRDVEITFWSKPDQRIAGRLREVSPVADALSRTYDARFQLLNPPSDLALGMTATVHLIASQSSGIPIPISAIADQNGIPCVWKIDSDRSVSSVPVSIVKYESGRAIVRANLYQGDEIISAGVQRIDADCRVRVWQDSR